MGYHHSDPTANMAISAAQREWTRMVKLALRIRTGKAGGDTRRLEAGFIGIYRQLLTVGMDELEKMLPNRGL